MLAVWIGVGILAVVAWFAAIGWFVQVGYDAWTSFFEQRRLWRRDAWKRQ